MLNFFPRIYIIRKGCANVLIVNIIPFIINRSGDYQDELGWSAIWLYQATGESKYLTDAEANRASGSAWGDSWDDKTASTNVCIIMQVTNPR